MLRNVRCAALLVAAIVGAVGFITYRGPTTGYWDTYIAVPAALIAGTPVEFVDVDGSPLYTARAPQRLPHDLVQPDAFRIATKDQQIGSGIHHALGFLALGRAGYRFAHAFGLALAALLAFLAIEAAGVRPALALPVGALVALNPMSLALGTLNPGLVSLSLIALVFLLLLTPEPSWLAAGLVLGVLGGVRDMSIFFIPALFVWLATERTRGRALALFALGALLTIAPVMAWKSYAYGDPLANPTQYAHFEGFRPFFPHHLGPLEFPFNGLLNRPFHATWVRTPHFAFPTVLSLPLVFLRCFGAVLGAAALVGSVALIRRAPRLAALTWTWFWLFVLFLAFQENWEELKMSTVLLVFVPWGLWIGVAGEALLARATRRVALAAVTTLAALFCILPRFAGSVDLPPDTRWYERFPHAARNESGLADLPDDERLTWKFFYTRETPSEVARNRRLLTSIWPWPMPYVPRPPGPALSSSRLAEEWGAHDLRIFEVWRRIYGEVALTPAAVAASN
ncbi:MAG: hypothetical protein U0610_10115 [bacterium]